VAVDAKGNIFGTTAFGGKYQKGTVWELSDRGNKFETLFSFDGANGRLPYAGVTLAGGNLYGTAESGGADDKGTVWEIDSNRKFLFASFNGANGRDPLGGVTVANRNLYGTASEGGAKEWGTVWMIKGLSVSADAPEPSSLIMGLISLALTSGAVALTRRLALRH
jgi:uncharacterized repeat protein (TIGR03803 family)